MKKLPLTLQRSLTSAHLLSHQAAKSDRGVKSQVQKFKAVNLEKTNAKCLTLYIAELSAYSPLVYILAKWHNGKSCFIGVRGKNIIRKLIYIIIKQGKCTKVACSNPCGPWLENEVTRPLLQQRLLSPSKVFCMWPPTCGWQQRALVAVRALTPASTCRCVNATQGITGKGQICPVDSPWTNKSRKLIQCSS